MELAFGQTDNHFFRSRLRFFLIWRHTIVFARLRRLLNCLQHFIAIAGAKNGGKAIIPHAPNPESRGARSENWQAHSVCLPLFFATAHGVCLLP